MGRLSRLYKYLPLLECAGIIAFVAILVLPDFWMYGGSDYGGYFNKGRLIANGQLPYIDFWDHKNPLYYSLLGLWQLVFGSSWWSAKAALVPTYGLFALSIYVFCKVVFQRRWLPIAAALAGAYLALRLGFDPARNGSILVFAASLELFALSFLFRGLLRSQRIPYFFLIAGVLAACAFLARQTSIVTFVIAAGAPFFLIDKNRRLPRFKEITRVLAPFLAGAAAIFVAFFGFILVAADIRAWYDQAIVFNKAYVTVSAPYDDGAMNWLMDWAWILSRDRVMWIVALGGIALYPGFRAASLSQQTTAQLVRFKFAYSCLFVSLVCVVATLKPHTMYTLQYLPYLVILSIVAIVDYAQLVRRLTIRGKPGLVFVLLCLILYPLATGIALPDVSGLRSWYLSASHYHFTTSQMPDHVVAREVDSLCGQDDTIYVHPGRRWVYLLSNKQSPIIYYFSNGLLWRGYKTPEEFQAEMSRLDKSPPKVVVYWGVRPGSNPLPKLYDDGYVKQFNQFVLSKYTLHKEVPLDQTWPYLYEEPAYIFVLKP